MVSFVPHPGVRLTEDAGIGNQRCADSVHLVLDPVALDDRDPLGLGDGKYRRRPLHNVVIEGKSNGVSVGTERHKGHGDSRIHPVDRDQGSPVLMAHDHHQVRLQTGKDIRCATPGVDQLLVDQLLQPARACRSL